MPGFGLGGSPALESNLWLSETAEPERSQKDLEGLGGPDNLVCQDETEHYVVWSTHTHTHTQCASHLASAWKPSWEFARRISNLENNRTRDLLL